jgi:hypothetical protein
MCAGAGAGCWWEDQTATPGFVIYGQSGLADTSMLEAAQQNGGCRTVHWVHGLSGGWNFAGNSSLGLFKCGHDADLHSGLPEYGETDFLALPKPAFRVGSGEKWLLLTNYAHPSNPFHTHGSTDLEIGIVRMAAEAAAKADVSPTDLIWRPHPAFWSLSEAVRGRILKSVSDTGVRMPDRQDEAPRYGDFRTILCTLSTVAIDILTDGILPVIVTPHAIDAESAYAGFPFRAANSGQIADAVESLSDPVLAASSFEQAWLRIRPGNPDITLDEIITRLSG